MAGTFTIGETKTRPGIYHRYENAGGVSIAGAINGIGAGVIQANWGPLNQAIEMEPSTKVNQIFGSGKTEDLITKMFDGGITSGFFVRAGTGGTVPSVKLKNNSETDAGTLTGAYVGDRKFTVTIRDSLTTDDRECIIYDGTTEFLKVSFPSGEGEPKALKEALAAKTKDFIFTPEDSVNGPLKDVLQEVITPGTNPTASTTEYSAAFDALEPYVWNVLCVDTEDTAIHTLMATYLNRIYEAGAYPMGCVAPKTSTALDTRMTNAAAFNDPKMHYVLNSAKDASGNVYEGYKLAARVGGMIAAIASNQSLTHKVLSGMTDLVESLTNTQIINALKKGCIVLTKNESGQVQIEQGINTLITPNGEQDEGWKKIRRVKTRFELMQRVDDTTEKLVGKVDNDTDGRATVIAAGNGVIKTMIGEKKLLDGTKMLEDDSNPAQGDSAWFVFEVYDKDSMEKAYMTYRFRFAADTSGAE